MIDTDRLHLRPLRTTDTPEYAAIWAKPEVVRFLPSEGDTSHAVATANAFIREWGEQAWSQGYHPWAVIDLSSRRLAGHAGLRFSPTYGAPELVYMFDSEFWGRGYALEAALAACDFARERLALNYLMGVAIVENVRSVAVMRKAGFTYEGQVQTGEQALVRYGRKL